jgi:hypothetical protein
MQMLSVNELVAGSTMICVVWRGALVYEQTYSTSGSLRPHPGAASSSHIETYISSGKQYHIVAYIIYINHRRPSSIIKTITYTIYLLGSGLSKLKSKSPNPSLVVLIPIVFLPLPGTGIVGGPSLAPVGSPASSGPPVGGKKVNPPKPTDP